MDRLARLADLAEAELAGQVVAVGAAAAAAVVAQLMLA